ncbi:hypothetical protein [Jiella mangrovi]|uniref:Single-stranded DNA-binding protein n=1 Tax=Jiella mangrovi TaxID=2821407 RepID=A0ABS4BNE2_9HYPH|nr:hypothetical protein [Jiella mangrovi]MBP0618263.1 hypothetical protein [Jiella mangrovi]
MDEAYFKNNVTIGGKVRRVNRISSDCTELLIETLEVWPDGTKVVEIHEARYYDGVRKPVINAERITGHMVRVEGRIRLKSPGSAEYRPFIHCHRFEITDSLHSRTSG